MKVLSCDGGGIRGYIPAQVLAEWEAMSGRPMASCVDLFAGTSTGAIVALAMAAGDIPARRVEEFYFEKGPAIFSRSLAKRVESLGGLIDELYDAGELEIGLHELFEDRKLSDVQSEAVATAYDIETRKTVVFRSRAAKASPREDYLLADVARASAAAPTYFEPCLIHSMGGTSHACIDGGVVANNPAMVAVSECTRVGSYVAGDADVVSLGTGSHVLPVLLVDAKDWGPPAWARPLLDIVFSGQSEESARLCAAILGRDRYVRLQPCLPRDIPMDATDAEAYALMRLAARQVLDSPEAARALSLLEAA